MIKTPSLLATIVGFVAWVTLPDVVATKPGHQLLASQIVLIVVSMCFLIGPSLWRWRLVDNLLYVPFSIFALVNYLYVGYTDLLSVGFTIAAVLSATQALVNLIGEWEFDSPRNRVRGRTAKAIPSCAATEPASKNSGSEDIVTEAIRVAQENRTRQNRRAQNHPAMDEDELNENDVASPIGSTSEDVLEDDDLDLRPTQ